MLYWGLSVVAWSAAKYDEALKILTDNASLFRKIPNHTLRGFYHNQRAMVLRKLVSPQRRVDQLKRIINEYEQADEHFKLARNTVFRAHVKNNIGNVFRELSRFSKAHEYLDHARRLTINVRDKVRTAQVDESRAQAFIAEDRYAEAEFAARNAARSFAKAGRQCFLAEALITRGIALARLLKTGYAQLTLQQAIEVAQQAGAPNRAGIAALTLIEEIDLPLNLLLTAHDNASEWLADSQSEGLSQRLIHAARKVIAKLRDEEKRNGTMETLFNRSCHLPDEILKFERAMISKALAKTDGSVVYAAKWLGIGYQLPTSSKLATETFAKNGYPSVAVYPKASGAPRPAMTRVGQSDITGGSEGQPAKGVRKPNSRNGATAH